MSDEETTEKPRAPSCRSSTAAHCAMGAPTKGAPVVRRQRFAPRLASVSTSSCRTCPKIVRDETSKDSDKIRAIEVLGRIGLDRAISIEDVKAALRETNHEIYDFLPRDQADALVARLRPIWRKL
jgi:hypothetical protein